MIFLRRALLCCLCLLFAGLAQSQIGQSAPESLTVMSYNIRRQEFPTVILAGMLGFADAQLFQIEEAAERSAPKVSFT